MLLVTKVLLNMISFSEGTTLKAGFYINIYIHTHTLSHTGMYIKCPRDFVSWRKVEGPLHWAKWVS